MSRLPALIAAAILLLTPAVSWADREVNIGLSEQQPSFMVDPLFKETEIERARLIVPWNGIYHQWSRDQLDTWLWIARGKNIDVLVSFGPSRNRNKALPSPGRYGRAVSDFQARYPWVKSFSTWNEPNLGKARKQPRLIAAYYHQLRHRAPKATIIAAEVVDNRHMVKWLNRFQTAAPEAELWGLHNYFDANHFSTRGTETMLNTVSGRVWLTETGGIVRRPDNLTRGPIPTGLAHQSKVTRYLLETLPYISPRIHRIYLYHWQAEPDRQAWDSGLLDADGKPRQAYFIVKNRVDDGQLTTPPESGPKAPEPTPPEIPSSEIPGPSKQKN